MPRHAAFLILLLGATAASADWLVTRDGARIETAGPWQVRRSAVVFTSANGTLSSLRLAEVDLEASAVATDRAIRPMRSPSPTPKAREPVLVLTHRDIRRAASAESSAAEESELPDRGEEGEESSGGVEPAPVEVISWHQRRTDDFDGVEILGAVQNGGGDLVTDIVVEVSLVEPWGELIASADAFLDSPSLAAGATISFRAVFPDVLHFAGAPRFEVRAQKLWISPEPASENEPAR